MTKKQKDKKQEEEPVVENLADNKDQEPCSNCEESIAGWKRALADYDNLKKDLLKEKDAMRQSTKESLAYVLFPVLDNFDQALMHQPEGIDKKIEGWITGVLHVRNQLDDVLRELGLEPFGSEGDLFDENLHEAVSQETDEKAKDQTILKITQRGWMLKEKVIRPAKVVVNNKK